MTKYLLTAISLALCISCGGDEDSFQGNYTCSDCEYQALYFKPGGDALLKAYELEIPASYTKDDNKIIIEIETGSYTFLLQKDGTLKGTGDVQGNYTKEK